MVFLKPHRLSGRQTTANLFRALVNPCKAIGGGWVIEADRPKLGRKLPMILTIDR